MAETSEDFIASLGLETDPDKVEKSAIVPSGELYKISQELENQTKLEAAPVSFSEGFGIGAEEEWISSIAKRNYERFTTDASAPITEFTPEITSFLTEDLDDPDAYREVLEMASEEGLEKATVLRDSYLQTQANINRASEAGFFGTSGYIAATFLDPSEWAAIGATTAAVSAASGVFAPITGTATAVAGAGKQAYKAFKVGTVARRTALLGGLEAAAFEAYRAKEKYDVDGGDVAIAAGAGIILGGTLGGASAVFSRNAKLSQITKKKINNQPVSEYEEAFYNQFRSPEAEMKALDKNVKNLEKTLQNTAERIGLPSDAKSIADMSPEELEALPKLGGANFFGLRNAMFTSARLGNSDMDVARQAGRKLTMTSTNYEKTIDGEEVVSNMSASEVQEVLQLKYRATYASVHRDNFKSWSKRTGGDVTSFDVLVSRARRGIIDDADPEVKAVSDLVGRQQLEMFDLGIDANAAGFVPQAKVKDNYLARIFSNVKITALRQRLGANSDVAIARLIRKAIVEGQPEIQENVKTYLTSKFKKKKVTDEEVENYITKVSEGYAKGIMSPNFAGKGNNSEITLEELRKIFKDNVDEFANLTEDDLDDIIGLISGSVKPKGHKRTQPRLVLNERTTLDVEDADGNIQTINFHDLLEEDMDILHNSYIFQTGGAIGLARNGIDTNDVNSSLNSILKAFDEEALAKKKTKEEVASERQAIEYAYNTITGGLKKDSQISNTTSDRLILLRAFSFAASMGMSGVSALMELSTVLASTSLPVLIKSVPQFAQILTKASRGQLPENVLQEYMDILGYGNEVALGKFTNNTRLEDISSLDNELSRKNSTPRKLIGKAQSEVAFWSGLTGVTQSLRRANAITFSNTFANAIKKGKLPFHNAHLAQLGLSKEMAVEIMKDMKANSTIKSGRVTKLDIQKWRPETREAFTNAMSKEVRQNVQEVNVGSTNQLLRNEYAKTLFQFLQFPMASLEQQFNRLLSRGKRGDVGVGKIIMAGMLQGTLLYMVRVQLNALGREDADEYIKENMTPERIAAGAISQLGATSFFGLVYDQTVGNYTGNIKMITPPAVGLAQSAVTGAKIVGEGLEGTEAQWRQAMRVLPFQSLYIFNQALNALAADLAKK